MSFWTSGSAFFFDSRNQQSQMTEDSEASSSTQDHLQCPRCEFTRMTRHVRYIYVTKLTECHVLPYCCGYGTHFETYPRQRPIPLPLLHPPFHLSLHHALVNPPLHFHKSTCIFQVARALSQASLALVQMWISGWSQLVTYFIRNDVLCCLVQLRKLLTRGGQVCGRRGCIDSPSQHSTKLSSTPSQVAGHKTLERLRLYLNEDPLLH